MKIEDVFRIETTGTSPGAWRLVPRRPIETRDGKMLTVKPASPVVNRWRFSDGPTRDTVLSCPTPAELEEWSKRMATMSGFDGGTLWQGDLKPVGEAVARVTDALRRVKGKARAKDALSKAVCAIANYGNYLETSEASEGPAGALAFGGNDEMTLSDVYEANNITPSKAATGDSGGAQMRRVRDQTGNEVASINAQNAAFWDKQTVWQKR